MTKVEIAWLAGLLEGEGCFGLYQDKRRPTTYTVKIQIEMTDKDVIDRIHNLVGGRVWESNYPSKYRNFPNAKPSWRWSVSSQSEVSRVIEAVYPLMSLRRQARCDEILSYINRSEKLIAQV